MRKILSVISISVLVALLSVVLGFKSIVFFVGVLIVLAYLYYSFKYTSKAFWFTYFVVLSLPIGNNNILEYITIRIKGIGINIIPICIGIIFCIVCIKHKEYKNNFIKNNLNKWFIILYLIYFISILNGILNGNERIIEDFVMYAYQAFLFYCTFKLVKNSDDIYKIMNITMLAQIVNCILTIIMYFTHDLSIWGIQYNGGRFGGNYLTLIILTVSYALFLIYNRKNKINIGILIAFLILSVSVMFISQNRTNPLLLLLSSGIMFFITLFNKKSTRNLFQKLIMIIVILIFFVGFITTALKSNNEFVQRFTNITSISEDKNMKTRINTFKYYSDLIIKNPMGSGFGTLMPFIDSSGRVKYENSLNVDNTYLNIGRKVGVIGLILYILIILSPIKGLTKIYLNNRDMIYLSIMIAYCMLLIAASMVTSQSIHSYSVSSFIWVFISYVNIKLTETK